MSDNPLTTPFEVCAFTVESEVDAGTEVWGSLGDPEREALVALVAVALERMRLNVDEWLPAAAVARSNSKIGFFVLWENDLFHSEVIRMQAQAKADEAAQVAELIRMARGTE